MRTTAATRIPVVLALCLCVSAMMPSAAPAEELGLASAINKAGRQRMLSQRILLTYCEIGLGVMPDDSRQRLAEAVDLFDRQLAELGGFAPTVEVVEALHEVERLWDPFRKVALQSTTREGARRLLFWNDDLLHATNKVVQILQDISDESYARLVNVAGRQRMLSQRAAKFYMLQEWQFDTLTIRDELERARNEFTGALAALRAAPENTKEIQDALGDVELQWMWFDHALTLTGEQPYRLIVADSAEAILTKMDKVTSMYEELFRR